jgi:hypothetical protein
MVRIKFSTHPRIPAISPSISLMASENVGIVSAEHKESSTERLDTSFAEKELVGSTEMTSKPDAQSDESKASDDTGDSGNASDNGGRVKVGAEAALARMSFDFGQSKVTKGCVSDLESSSCFSPKGLLRLLGIESVMVPREDEVVVFEDFFVAGLRIPLHPILLAILHKFQVQLHQLTPNAIVQISKFIWAVTSCEDRPNAEVFAHHYELHYQNKKIHLEGCDTMLAAQFGCISFHPSRFGNHARLTLATRNKWTSGWDSN